MPETTKTQNDIEYVQCHKCSKRSFRIYIIQGKVYGECLTDGCDVILRVSK